MLSGPTYWTPGIQVPQPSLASRWFIPGYDLGEQEAGEYLTGKESV